MRNRNLDIYRGLIIIYIVGIVHVHYWTNIEFGYKSLLLFEMPVIFFITGASHALSKPKPFDVFLFNRLKRVLLPYWGYALLSVILLLLFNASNLNTDTRLSFVGLIIGWMNPFGNQSSNIVYLNEHLWFLPVYIMVILGAFPLYKVFLNLPAKLKFLPLIFFGFYIFYADFNTFLGTYVLLKYTVFYMFWAYLGFYYSLMQSKSIKPVFVLLISGIFFLLTFYFIKVGNYSWDMQLNKFPPNFIFLLYTISCFNLLVLFSKYIIKLAEIKPVSKVIKIYSSYGYTIYLYHTFTFIFLHYISGALVDLIEFKPVLIIGYSLFTIVIGTLYPFLFGRLEKLSMGRKNGLRAKISNEANTF